MTKPLTLLLYERLFPGAQLATRLEDLGYRVKTVNDPGSLLLQVEKEKPILVVADLGSNYRPVCMAIESLRRNEATAHVPVMVTSSPNDQAGQRAAQQAGAALVVNDNAVLMHLKHFLDQALQLD